jgi:RNA polymerase sigma-70 factor (ECF subfamily)
MLATIPASPRIQMRIEYYARMVDLARRWSRRPDEAEDIVQEALLVAVGAGRADLSHEPDRRWLAGVIRNRARMAARTATRRSGRDSAWQSSHAEPPVEDPADTAFAAALPGLPPALKSLAALVLTGHSRREIAYLLKLTDPALRQRVAALKRFVARNGIAMPADMAGLTLDLAYGRIRDALVPALQRHGGAFASHDPDGHLFLIKPSRPPG